MKSLDESSDWDVILADYSLPSFDGISALQLAVEKRPEVPFIFVTGALGEELAVETLTSGATDFVLKHQMPVSSSDLDAFDVFQTGELFGYRHALPAESGQQT